MPSTSLPGTNSSGPILTDLLIRAGSIYSMAQDRRTYRAIAIRDEWIVAVSEDPHGLDHLITAGTFLDIPIASS